MSNNPSPDPLISLFAAIRTYAEATALPAPTIYGLRQFFRYITPTPPRTEAQDARVLYPSLLDHDDPVERNHPPHGTQITSRGTQTPAARAAPPTNDPLAPDNAVLRNLWRCCSAVPRHVRAPPYATRVIYLILLLAAFSIALAGLAAIPGAHARPLTATEHLPSSTAGLFRAMTSLSLLIAISRLLFIRVAAAVTEIPDLPEPTTAGATAFVMAIAAGYLLVRKPRPDTPEAGEVIEEGTLTDERWKPFLQDITAPEFAEWKAGIINDRHSKNTLRGAILSLYARLQACLDLGERQKEFISFLNDNPPGGDILARLCTAVEKDDNDWKGAIEKTERWCGYVKYVYHRIWPLFPDVTENEKTSGKLFRKIDELCRVRNTVARHAAGYTLAHGLPVETDKIEDLQHWVNVAPREFEKDIAQLFVPQPTTRTEILERIRSLVTNNGNGCTHPPQLAARMRNEVTTTWEESLRGIANLQALAPATVVS